MPGRQGVFASLPGPTHKEAINLAQGVAFVPTCQGSHVCEALCDVWSAPCVYSRAELQRICRSFLLPIKGGRVSFPHQSIIINFAKNPHLFLLLISTTRLSVIFTEAGELNFAACFLFFGCSYFLMKQKRLFLNTFINKKENKIHHHIIDIRVTRVQK
jgi:hypothetical protein